MKDSEPLFGIAHTVIAALLLAVTAASQVQADPAANGSAAPAVISASALAVTPEVRPEVRAGEQSKVWAGVPVDGAFSGLTGQQISDLIHHPESLRSLVAAHIVPGRVLTDDLIQGKGMFSLSGDRIEVDPPGRAQVDGTTLIKTVLVSPVVVHVVDGLLQSPRLSDA